MVGPSAEPKLKKPKFTCGVLLSLFLFSLSPTFNTYIIHIYIYKQRCASASELCEVWLFVTDISFVPVLMILNSNNACQCKYKIRVKGNIRTVACPRTKKKKHYSPTPPPIHIHCKCKNVPTDTQEPQKNNTYISMMQQ